MSRIGKMPIAIPSGVTFTVTDRQCRYCEGTQGRARQRL